MDETQEAEAIEFVTYLSKSRGLSINSIETYLKYFKRFDAQNISQEYIDSFLKMCKNINPVRAMVQNYLEFKGLERQFFLPRPSKRKAVRLIRPISDEEIMKLKDYMYSLSFKKGIVFDLILQGALRRCEIRTIKISSFDWLTWYENGMNGLLPLIVLGKNNRERRVLISEELGQAILSHLIERYNINTDEEQLKTTLRSNNPLFQFITEKQVWDIISKSSKKLLNRSIRPHEIRHQSATNLEKIGVPIKDIKNYLGHKSVATTEIYLHSSEKDSLDNIYKIKTEHNRT